jgi:hypothetical protein
MARTRRFLLRRGALPQARIVPSDFKVRNREMLLCSEHVRDEWALGRHEFWHGDLRCQSTAVPKRTSHVCLGNPISLGDIRRGEDARIADRVEISLVIEEQVDSDQERTGILTA